MIIQYPFDDENNYNFDDTKLEFDSGVCQVKKIDNPNQEFRQDFDNDTGFTYDSDKIYFDSGMVKQKNQRKANCTCGATWTNSVNLSFGEGAFTPTYNNGAVITNNKLDLTGGKTIRFNADKNADSQQIGAVRIKITPNYSGTPSSTAYFLKIAKSTSSNANIVTLYHYTNGCLYFMIKDYAAATLFQTNLGTWSPTAGQTYRFLIVWDIDSGNSKVYIDGVQFGNTYSQTGVRDSNISLLEFSGDFYAEDLEIFTVNPGASDYSVPEADYVESVVTLPDFVYSGAGTIQSLDSFYSADFDDIHYTIEGKYWNGSNWVVSDNSYSQSNSYSVINNNINSLYIKGKDKISVKAIFPNSNDQGMINYMTIGYTGQHYPIEELSIYPKTSFRTDRINSLELTATSNVRIIVLKDSVKYYYDTVNSTWKTSDGSYSQANDISELTNDDVLNQLIEKNTEFKWELVLNSDGNTLVGVDNFKIDYSFAGDLPTINKTVIYGFYYEKGQPVENATIKVHSYFLIGNLQEHGIADYETTTDVTGYWEIKFRYGSVSPTKLYWNFNNNIVVTNFLSGYHSFGELTRL